MDRGAWQPADHGGHKELDTTEQLSTHAFNQLLKAKSAQSTMDSDITCVNIN